MLCCSLAKYSFKCVNCRPCIVVFLSIFSYFYVFLAHLKEMISFSIGIWLRFSQNLILSFLSYCIF